VTSARGSWSRSTTSSAVDRRASRDASAVSAGASAKPHDVDTTASDSQNRSGSSIASATVTRSAVSMFTTRVADACGSRSTTSVRTRLRANAAAIPSVTVVCPRRFWLANA
jgi:hypothetical protein